MSAIGRRASQSERGRSRPRLFSADPAFSPACIPRSRPQHMNECLTAGNLYSYFSSLASYNNFSSGTLFPTVLVSINRGVMAPEDSKAPFLRIPWTASLINRPNLIFRVPYSRVYKASTEDSLFAEILKTPRTIRSCIAFYQKPASTEDKIEEVSTLMTTGDGMNGHPQTMHGGIVASVIDEAMGILQSSNKERDHMLAVGRGHAEGELPPSGYSWYTAELKIRYLKPVLTPAPLICTARYTKRDGRKEWIVAELKQRVGVTEDYDGDEVVCATGEALFIQPKPKPSKL